MMDFTFLKDLLAQPSAPFRERHVAARVTRELAQGKVPHFFDPTGNIVIGVDSKEAYLSRIKSGTEAEPIRVFIAHMDHPGFHGVAWTPRGQLKIKWHGGSPTQKLIGAKVWLANDSGYVAEGKLSKVKLLPGKLALESGEVTMDAKSRALLQKREASELFGGFKFRAPIWEKNRVLYTKAADDLVGVGVLVNLAIQLQSEGKLGNFLAVLTRAEEVGFIGCIRHFELGWLAHPSRAVACVSLETSRTLEGAVIGKGPVVRLGDRATVFDPGAVQVLSGVAQRLLPKKHQRRIMDRGTCEATVAVAFGVRALGISIPLGNYHNESFEGGPDSRGKLGPGPEFVHKQDVEGMLTLCRGLMEPGLSWSAPWEARRADFRKRSEGAQSLLALN